MQFVCSENESSKRLDESAKKMFPTLSRSSITKLIKDKKILVNGSVQKNSYKLKIGDIITSDFEESELSNIPDISLPVIHEDQDIIVIDKPVGVLTHSKGNFNPEATVASFICNKVNDLDGNRAGIVHRLDRATSGVILCAKHEHALKWFQKQFSDRTVIKEYVAITQAGINPEKAMIDAPISRNSKKPKLFCVSKDGKSAQTYYEVTKKSNTHWQLLLRPRTGRTHQLRVHLQYVGYPILGDDMYGGPNANCLHLHAYKLTIKMMDNSTKTFVCALPKSFQDTVS